MAYIQLKFPHPGGQQLSFDFVFKKYYPEIRQFANKLIRDIQEAEDITQESFIKLFRQKQEFEKEGNIKGFLFIVTRNACLNFLKARRKMKFTDTVLGAIIDDNLADPGVTSVKTFLETEFHDKLRDALDQLPDKCRRVMELFYLEGKPYEEIGVILSIEVENARVQRQKGVQKLKARYKELLAANGIFNIMIFILLYLQFRAAINTVRVIFKNIF